MPTSSEIKLLRKSGNLKDALEQARHWVSTEPGNIWANRALGWVIYDLTKQDVLNNNWEQFTSNLDELISLKLPKGEEMIGEKFAFQIGKMLFSKLKNYQGEYHQYQSLFEKVSSLPFPKPSAAYSFLLGAFHKAFKDTSYYLTFSTQWNFKYFRLEDFEETQLQNGKSIMSIGEQVIIAQSKALLQGENDTQNQSNPKVINHEKIKSFLPFLDRVIEKFPKLKYSTYYKGKLLMSIGSNESALEAFLPFAQKNQNHFWVWDILGDFYYAKSDLEKSISIYAAALSCRSPREFLIKVKEKLAKLLVQSEQYKLAKVEIEEIVFIRQENNWRLSNDIKKWQESDWYKTAIAPRNNRSFYAENYSSALKYLYPNLAYEIVAINYVNEDRRMANWVRNKSRSGFFRYDSFLRNIRVGDSLKLGFHKSENKEILITAEKTDKISVSVKTVKGNLKLHHSRNFGFVDDVFVPGYLLNQLNEGIKLSVTAVLSYEKKKEKWSWKGFQVRKS
jgi:hypothetical protein